QRQRNKHLPGCGNSRPAASLRTGTGVTFDGIVSDYIREYRDDARAEMQTFRREKSRGAAIRRAAQCEFLDGKRHPHQYLIPKRLLTLAEERLQAAARRLGNARDFAALHEIVKHEIGS